MYERVKRQSFSSVLSVRTLVDALGIRVSLDCEVYESSPMWL